MVDSQYYLPNDIGISVLDCAEAFRLLSPKEQLYAHYLSRAAWYGGLVVLLQTSPESPSIYVLLQRIFRKQTPAQLDAVAAAVGLSSDEYQVRNGFLWSQLIAVPQMLIIYFSFASGISCVCCWSLCKHGKLQIIW